MLDRYELHVYKQWLRVYMRGKMIKHNKDLFECHRMLALQAHMSGTGQETGLRCAGRFRFASYRLREISRQEGAPHG
jgi:hypothetical protein